MHIRFLSFHFSFRRTRSLRSFIAMGPNRTTCGGILQRAHTHTQRARRSSAKRKARRKRSRKVPQRDGGGGAVLRRPLFFCRHASLKPSWRSSSIIASPRRRRMDSPGAFPACVAPAVARSRALSAADVGEVCVSLRRKLPGRCRRRSVLCRALAAGTGEGHGRVVSASDARTSVLARRCRASRCAVKGARLSAALRCRLARARRWLCVARRPVVLGLVEVPTTKALRCVTVLRTLRPPRR